MKCPWDDCNRNMVLQEYYCIHTYGSTHCYLNTAVYNMTEYYYAEGHIYTNKALFICFVIAYVCVVHMCLIFAFVS